MCVFGQISDKEINLDKLKLFLNSYKQIFGEIEISEEEVMTYLRHSLLELTSFFIKRYCLEEERKKYTPGFFLIDKYYLKLKLLVNNEKLLIKLFK